ncbi:pullulanase-type alpha-1,6-glucosidase [Pseudomonas sp. LPB0260]|uniref:pullulanase-type alpha-1,6-glucosidase n=1 Tax=Pseudomonas sp. LPB0260 TaxID=2614442 RepID=UPI0015C276B8|nr:pullulanase-type alpha-1,6-glucosidase [Pseudomonas sp. LPB0260]QLC72699.1 pullulanase-type alpha-1,6-glucosidase [Pseudomonas sp. LPB0260]QLC75473.1 pullulanase-type alpha-1,6-glucosidase [Pseudomonas sp. LPB0260]
MPPLRLPRRLFCLLLSGLSLIASAAAEPLEPGPAEALLYYQRPAGDYAGWGLHLWNTGQCNGTAEPTSWEQPLLPAGVDGQYGAWYRIALSGADACLNLIMHKGNDKDLGGGDLQWRFAELGRRVFSVSGQAQLSATPIAAPALSLDGARGHWLDARSLVLVGGGEVARVELRYAPDADLQIDAEQRRVRGGEVIALRPGSLSERLKRRFPHLAGQPAYRIDADRRTLRRALKSQLWLLSYDAEERLSGVTQVQTPGVLDDLYAYSGRLGAEVRADGVRFRLWAPTAQWVRLHLFDQHKRPLPGSPVSLREHRGVWRHDGPKSLDRRYYQYEVRVYHPSSGRLETTLTSDPYALSLSRNSRYAQVVDLDAADLKPAGWDSLRRPRPRKPEASVIYETHVRDFSASDHSLPAAQRGTYAAFAQPHSQGMQHLRELKDAGLTHVQLLPAFDLATVDEDPAQRVDLDDPFARLCERSPRARQQYAAYCAAGSVREVLQRFDPAGSEAQALYGLLRDLDSFNWGYDPLHYSVPEGSYASDAEGVQRIIEFRRMVQALTELGLNTVLDVVYNHTHASGLDAHSVLDKLVPGYYHRRDPQTGAVERSTCCANTASEHRMMEKLMIDSLRLWARDYKIAGFRFDLMGHHMRRNILAAREAVRRVDPDTYFYGEGWNFGEVANDARGINASQLNMAGSGVGTFNDRLRDAVRGGGPFDGGDSLRRNQGFANGLYVLPNELNSGAGDEREQLLRRMDWIRVGVAGGLRSYVVPSADGSLRRGADIDYNGQPAGYTDDPQESINYVSKHDNQTLWDNNQYKLAASLGATQRVRLQLLGLAVPLFSQGVPFLHMGGELLRSKSMERDSYDSGDWFNAVDFGYQHNNWNKGLPRQDKDGDNWPLIRQIIADPNAQPSAAHILAAKRQFLELLRIRSGSPLFQLGSGEAVRKRLAFHNTGPAQLAGVLAFSLDDSRAAGADLDPQVDALMVILNASGETISLPGALPGYRLHPLLAASSDPLNRSARVEAGQFQVPALTAAVFVLPQGRDRRR